MSDPQATVEGEEHAYFTALKSHCATQPDAVEGHPWGETVFKLRGKVFAFLGTSQRASLIVKPQPDDLDGLLALPFVDRAPYIGRYGWIAIQIADAEALGLARDLIDASYEIIASKSTKRRQG